MFVWRWHYRYDTVLMHGGIQGSIVYMYDAFGVHGNLYVEVIRTQCLMAKHENGPHDDTHHVWCRRKLLIPFYVQGLWCSICRRSSLKYEAWKWIKMGVKCELWIKVGDFRLEWQFGTPMFFVRLVMMHTECVRFGGFKGENYGKGKWTQTQIHRKARITGTKGEL